METKKRKYVLKSNKEQFVQFDEWHWKIFLYYVSFWRHIFPKRYGNIFFSKFSNPSAKQFFYMVLHECSSKIHDSTWIFMGNPRFHMNVHAKCTTLHGNSCKMHDFARILTKMYDSAWIFIKMHDFTWTFMQNARDFT